MRRHADAGTLKLVAASAETRTLIRECGSRHIERWDIMARTSVIFPAGVCCLAASGVLRALAGETRLQDRLQGVLVGGVEHRWAIAVDVEYSEKPTGAVEDRHDDL